MRRFPVWVYFGERGDRPLPPRPRGHHHGLMDSWPRGRDESTRQPQDGHSSEVGLVVEPRSQPDVASTREVLPAQLFGGGPVPSKDRLDDRLML